MRPRLLIVSHCRRTTPHMALTPKLPGHLAASNETSRRAQCRSKLAPAARNFAGYPATPLS
jgi:hypothetical protein